MAACAAVFNTGELAEAILRELPPHSLGAALEVCHHWRSIIKNTKHMPSLKVVVPSNKEDHPGVPLLVYAADPVILWHPALALRTTTTYGSRNGIRDTIPSYIRHYAAFDGDRCITSDPRWKGCEARRINEACGQDFASNPPIQRLDFGLPPKNRTSLFVKGGIRMWHIKEMIDKLSAVPIEPTIRANPAYWARQFESQREGHVKDALVKILSEMTGQSMASLRAGDRFPRLNE